MLRSFILKSLILGGWFCLTLSACQSAPVAQTPAASPSVAPSPVVSPSPSPSPAKPPAATATPSPIFRQVFPALKSATQIPVLLPGYVPEADTPDRVFAILETADASTYQILLAFTEDCRGGTACRLGQVTGAVATPKAAVVAGKAVQLNNGIMGDFVEAKCGANCSDATLTWDQDGYRYMMAIKAGREETLVRMANSAIANGPL